MLRPVFPPLSGHSKADIEEPPSDTEGQHVTIEDDTEKAESDKAEEEPTRAGIATNEQLESITKKLVPASKVLREDPDEPIRVPYMIDEKMHYLNNDEINAHLKKEDKIKKVAKEAKMFENTKTKVIKVVQEEDEKIGLDLKIIVNAQAVKRLMELNKKRAEKYMWTIYNRHKPEPITDVRIHPNSKPAVLIRYERLKKIPEELRIQSALPAPIPKQAPSQSSRRKRKNVELEPKINVPGLECNRSLPEGVPFVNNKVIEEPEYGIFFTNVFGDQAFQRWNEIHKVGIESLVSYLVMASMTKTLKNARFCLKLKKLIAEHLDQEKLQSKKVKMELVGYKLAK
ncbi:hypothetical protein Tco_0369103 [Tanacetum coccineum]